VGNYILRRLVWVVITVFAIVTITYFITYAVPSDPARVIAGPHATPEVLQGIRRALGLNKPIWVRYLDFLGQLVRGNLGWDFILHRPVAPMVLQAAPNTLYLAIAAVIFELLIAIPVGIISAVKRYSFIDNVVRVLAVLGISMPTYWVGSLLLLIFGFYLGWFPLGGTSLPGVVLPAASYGITGAAYYARILRSSMLDVMRYDYVRTARAKGLHERLVLFRHIFRNALLPVVTYLGLDLGSLLGGLIITETIFNWSGLGLLLNIALNSIDGALIMALTLFSATSIVVMNFLVDIVYAFLDPRISYS
jgi:peptide/nickel transport system permease protein